MGSLQPSVFWLNIKAFVGPIFFLLLPTFIIFKFMYKSTRVNREAGNRPAVNEREEVQEIHVDDRSVESDEPYDPEGENYPRNLNLDFENWFPGEDIVQGEIYRQDKQEVLIGEEVRNLSEEE